jgi:P27 family predicted phage terminase small subunit
MLFLLNQERRPANFPGKHPPPSKQGATMSRDFEPPRKLDPAAREVWDRQQQRLYRDGRWLSVDHDLLCLFAETTSLYLRLKADVDKHGMLVPGRGDGVLVRNPAFTPLAQCRADLVRIAKAVPLTAPARAADGLSDEVDALLAELR